MVTAAAVICARDEALHIRRCLQQLISDGIDVVLIDHASSDATVELAKEFLGQGLLGIEHLAWTGEFSLAAQLAAKHDIMQSLPHDWLIHVDADEWLCSPAAGETLLEGIRSADAAGANCINFNEFVFVPAAGEDFTRCEYQKQMLGYYFFEPDYPRLMRAWRRDADLDNRPYGHVVEGKDVRVYQFDFILRHYIVLSLAHGQSKYLRRVFAGAELDRGQHQNRVNISEESLMLPARPELEHLGNWQDKTFSRARPRRTHFWEWNPAAVPPGNAAQHHAGRTALNAKSRKVQSVPVADPPAALRVAVVTPYHAEPLETLRQCHDSVTRQTFPCLHVMVADGQPRDEMDAWAIDHVRLPRSHGDIGSTPRLIGCYHAIGLGCTAVAFLDADNAYREDHIESLVRLQQETGAGFVSSSRVLCRLDGSVMGPCPNTDPEKFIDTSCMMLTRPALSAATPFDSASHLTRPFLWARGGTRLFTG